MGLDGWSLIGRLKRAVKKIRFMLNFDINRWKVASLLGYSSSNVKRRVSLNDRDRGGGAGGLRGFMVMDDSDLITNINDSSSRVLRRTCSSPYYSYSSSSEDDNNNDIDKRADMFIANFYKQLQIERQISLQLRYVNNNFASPSPSPSPSP